jgi:hypothetical protein
MKMGYYSNGLALRLTETLTGTRRGRQEGGSFFGEGR